MHSSFQIEKKTGKAIINPIFALAILKFQREVCMFNYFFVKIVPITVQPKLEQEVRPWIRYLQLMMHI